MDSDDEVLKHSLYITSIDYNHVDGFSAAILSIFKKWE